MVLFKKKLTVEAAMRLVLHAALTRNPDSLLRDISASGALPPTDLEAIKRELRPFSMAVWFALFLQRRGNGVPATGGEELGKRFFVALVVAHLDTGLPREQAVDMAKSQSDSVFEYLACLDNAPADRLREAGPFFFLCQRFTECVLPSPGKNTPGDVWKSWQARGSQVFDIAMQDVQTATSAFEAILRQHRLVT